MLRFKGAAHFRQRILLSLLSGQAVKITDIRSEDDNPGLRDFEIRFLKLVEALTNGTSVEVGFTGTELSFRPGSIYGGEVEFDCGLERSLPYFLEPLLILAPFSKLAFRLELKGITSDVLDQTIDGVKSVNVRILAFFGVSEGIDFQVKKRGAAPGGGGLITFTCPTVEQLKPIRMEDAGQIKRIRGVASTTRVSPQLANRMVEKARSLLNTFLPDIYIYTDVAKGEDAGLSPGYSLFLQAESTSGAILSADGVGEPGKTPEELALSVSKVLLKRIRLGGIVDQEHNWMLILLMALTPPDVSKVLLAGPLSLANQQLLDEIKLALGVAFRVEELRSGELEVSCVGSGFCNLNRGIK